MPCAAAPVAKPRPRYLDVVGVVTSGGVARRFVPDQIFLIDRLYTASADGLLPRVRELIEIVRMRHSFPQDIELRRSAERLAPGAFFERP